MLLYHGVKSLKIIDDILSNGFTRFKRGFYGTGTYGTSDKNIALEFTHDENEVTNKNFILQFNIDESLIFEDTYKNIANKFFGKKEKKNLSYYCMDPLWNLDQIMRNLGYKACKINYIDTDEVIIF